MDGLDALEPGVDRFEELLVGGDFVWVGILVVDASVGVVEADVLGFGELVELFEGDPIELAELGDPLARPVMRGAVF